MLAHSNFTYLCVGFSMIGIGAFALIALSTFRKERARAKVAKYKGGPLNMEIFHAKFAAANKAMSMGNSYGLRVGLALFIECLDCAGDFATDLIPAIQALYSGLSHQERADTRGPWNRDLSGYGLFSWKKDLYERDDALQRAWPYIHKIDNELRALGLGWNY